MQSIDHILAYFYISIQTIRKQLIVILPAPQNNANRDAKQIALQRDLFLAKRESKKKEIFSPGES